MKRLEGNVTIITGGGKGIGFGLAQAFAQEGSNLVITGRTESRLLDAKKRLEEEYGIEVLPIVADGADESAIKNVVAKTVEKFGKITTLVNNAQVSKSGLPLVEHTKEDFDLAIYSCNRNQLIQ
ncbi:MAG: SDR family NAD(P)-dependent oxidoreductase [Bacteroidales bacterium]|nr:SDR family NAD(P)-dependent oxidoreductase [Bacteroidales bacterium]